MKLCAMCGKPKAAVYARISDDQKGERLGVADQIEDCWAKIADEDWCDCTPEADTYQDNDIGALRRKPRPGYIDLTAALATGRYAHLVARDDGRLTRNVREAAELVDLIERAKVNVEMLWTEHWDLTTAAGRKRVRDAFSDAQYEAERTGERVTRARKREARKGEPHRGGRRPWGFEDDNVTHRADEVAEIHQAALDLLAGKSLTSVAKRVERQPTTLRKALLSPRMVGKRRYRGQVFPGTWAPVLDDDTWLAVTAVLSSRKRGPLEPGGSRGRKYLLTGWLECGVCGNRLAGNGGGGSNVDGYKCVMACVRRRADWLDEMVRDWVLARADLQLPVEGVDPGLLAAVQGFEARLADLDREFDEGVEGMSAAVYARARGSLEVRLAEAQAKLESATAEPAWRDARGEGYSWWEKADLRQRRIEIGKYVERVIVSRTTKGPKFIDTDVEIVPKAK